MTRKSSPARWNAVLVRIAPVLAFGLGAILISTSSLAEEILSSVARGGRLYDNWHSEIGEPAPGTPHPAYPAAGRYVKESGATWRCKECHGWDYKGKDGAYAEGEHFTGITGIRGLAGADPARIVALLKDETHGYLGLLEDGDLRDLANFVAKGQVDMDRLIDPTSGLAKGDASTREAYFATICATCHGKDGQKIKTMPPLGKVARSNPWEALHKILNGHPAENMPALRAFDTQVLVEILAFAQSLPAEELLSSVVRGGRLYDNWYKEAKKPAPERPHSAYPADGTYVRDSETTWRCKECHGWDYKGREGVNSAGVHFTGITGIRGMAGADPARIVALLKDETHGYLGLLEDGDLRDLANFVAKGQIDMDKFIDPVFGMAKGDKTARATYYNTICATCHGKGGRKVTTMPPLGRVAKFNPWNALHKILNGHPDEEMPALRVLDIPILIDILAYAQTLPLER